MIQLKKHTTVQKIKIIITDNLIQYMKIIWVIKQNTNSKYYIH